MQAQASSGWDFEIRLVSWLALCISVFSFLYYYRTGDIMLYGDAEAHINIARRVFDSKTPGPLQLGTVWLPLPHLLMMPFLVSGKLWTTGVGGSIPSLVAYVFSVIGMFRLMRGLFGQAEAKNPGAHPAAWLAVAVYAFNPNLIYMQTTAMGEALYLAFFIWAVVHFAEYLRGRAHSLLKCGWCLLAASLTRYDGWFLAGILAVILIIRWAVQRISFRRLLGFVLIAAAAPALWLAYNAAVYGNPLEFENGPYSAKAIEKRSENRSAPGHPGSGNVYVSGLYFLKSAEWNMSSNAALQRIWVLLLFAFLAGLAWLIRSNRIPSSSWSLLLFAIPLPFYALSVAYAGVPIFIPSWWPFTQYNVRYGMQLLPAFAAALAILLVSASHLNLRSRAASIVINLSIVAFVAGSYASVWKAAPICLREAQVNMRGRIALETQLAKWLGVLPPNSTLLMYLGSYSGTLQRADIPISRVINEGNHRPWKRPTDPDGLWERALADPSKYANYAVAFEGDPVWQALHDRHFKELVEIQTTGQPRTVLYSTR